MINRNRYKLWVMDVFTSESYRGNPAAVVFDAAGITAETMQAIAREMNLSETAFVFAPTDPSAHYRVRFFTPMALQMKAHDRSRHRARFAGRLATRQAVTTHRGAFT
jgi:PhzF family phenazine biosynthesis protein